jgi:hypothetical protein
MGWTYFGTKRSEVQILSPRLTFSTPRPARDRGSLDGSPASHATHVTKPLWAEGLRHKKEAGRAFGLVKIQVPEAGQPVT